jgi:hypothetical protein
MDGRVQLPVIKFLQERFDVEYVDSITEPGPCLILSGQQDTPQVRSILARLRISVEKHHSVGVAVVGHHDCAGNPASRQVQHHQLLDTVLLIRGKHAEIPVIALWVDEELRVSEIPDD